MSRLTKNLGGQLLLVGGAVASIATFFPWMSITNATSGQTSNIVPIKVGFGQGMFLAGILAGICGIGVLASAGRGHVVWGLIGLFFIALLLAAGLVGVFSPETLAQWFASSEALTKAGLGSPADAAATVQAGFDAGTLSAAIKFGSILGLIAGAVGTLGALVGVFRKPAEKLF